MRNPAPASHLSFQDSGFQWRIVREGERSLMTVTGAGQTLTVPLLWAFGQGVAGQTYVFERDGAFYESRVSFYNALGGLDLTMGARRAPGISTRRPAAAWTPPPRGIASDATPPAGSPGPPAPGIDRARRRLRILPWPAEQHVAAVRAGNAAAAKMTKLAGHTAEEMSEFCGHCHRTWSQIALNGPRGVHNVRFQPYRLANSKCYDTADPRIRLHCLPRSARPAGDRRAAATMRNAPPAIPRRCTPRRAASPKRTA